MKKKSLLFLSIIVVIIITTILSVTVFASGESQAAAIEACIITEVFDWGETVSAIRIEYSEEINSWDIPYDQRVRTYNTTNIRSIESIYVNNSGKLDDVQPYGKYVFIKYGVMSADPTEYRDQVTFNESFRMRPKLDPISA